MGERSYVYLGDSETYHNTLGRIRPGLNTFPHLTHEVIMATGLVTEMVPAVSPEGAMSHDEPAMPVDSGEPARRESRRRGANPEDVAQKE